MGTQTPCSSGVISVLIFGSIQLWVTLLGLGHLVTPRLSLSYLTPCSAFIFCCRAAAQQILRSFSEWVVPYEAVDFLCLWEDVCFQDLSTLISWTAPPWLKCFKKKKKKKWIKCYLSRQQMEEKTFAVRSVPMCPAHNMMHRYLSGIAMKLENENLEESYWVPNPCQCHVVNSQGQPPMSSMNTWFYYSFLVLEDAQKSLCLTLKPQVIDIFFKISELYFQLMYFCENFFSFSLSQVPFLSFTFNIWFLALIPYMMRVWTEYHSPFKNVQFETFKCLGYLILNLPYGEPFYFPWIDVRWCYSFAFYWWDSIFYFNFFRDCFSLSKEEKNIWVGCHLIPWWLMKLPTQNGISKCGQTYL